MIREGWVGGVGVFLNCKSYTFSPPLPSSNRVKMSPCLKDCAFFMKAGRIQAKQKLGGPLICCGSKYTQAACTCYMYMYTTNVKTALVLVSGSDEEVPSGSQQVHPVGDCGLRLDDVLDRVGGEDQVHFGLLDDCLGGTAVCGRERGDGRREIGDGRRETGDGGPGTELFHIIYSKRISKGFQKASGRWAQCHL